MDEADKLYVDAGTPRAALIVDGKLTQCPTLGEAAMEWHRLPDGSSKSAATIRVGGTTYTAAEIDRMHYGPKPAV
jgi:hypothetical protein